MSVINAVTQTDQNQVNQYASGLNNTLGLVSTTQDALGRVVLPSGATLPSSPSSFQVAFSTILGVGGRLFIRHSNSQWVGYQPLRQIVDSSAVVTDQAITSTSLVDITGFTVSITTSGGKLLIEWLPAPVSGGSLATGLLITNNTAHLTALVGATALPRQFFGTLTAAGNIGITQLSAFKWIYQPAAGTYTVKLQAMLVNPVAGSNGSMVVELTTTGGAILRVTEYGD